MTTTCRLLVDIPTTDSATSSAQVSWVSNHANISNTLAPANFYIFFIYKMSPCHELFGAFVGSTIKTWRVLCDKSCPHLSPQGSNYLWQPSTSTEEFIYILHIPIPVYNIDFILDPGHVVSVVFIPSQIYPYHEGMICFTDCQLFTCYVLIPLAWSHGKLQSSSRQ